jgi:hypothetical protein
MNPLNLSVPQQHDFTDPTVERDVARLRDWLSNLPLMDVVETVRLVHAALNALNEQKLDNARRFQFLEIYRTTVLRLFVTLDPLHLRQLSLSKLQRREAIKGLAELFLSMAGGYKLIVMLLYRSLVPGKQAPELFGLAINRSLEQLGYALLDSYRFYRAPQPFMIAESHQLYRVARHHGLLDNSIPEADDPQAVLTTAMLYHTTMLLSLTDPSRLAEGEVGLLFDVLQQHANECRIIPGNQWADDGAGLFLLDLQADASPVPCTDLKSPAQAQEPYLLDAREALANVRKRLSSTPAKVRMQSPEAMLLRYLLPEGHGPGERRELRLPDGRHAALLLGLENIHQHMMTVSARQPPQAGTSGSQADTVACTVLDSSKGGMRLLCGSGETGDACVGDLLAVLEGETGARTLQLAIVRSLQVQPDGGMEVGVQVMPGGLGPVSCSAPDEHGETVHALFMPASEAEEIGATLIAAKGLYESGRHLLIDVGGREIHTRAGHLVVESPVFDRFEFSAK